MITLSHVAFSYEPEREILHDVSLELAPGSFHFLTGPSGTGKTSLLGLLSLAFKPTRGVIHMFGNNVTRLPRESLPLIRRKIGLVSQDFRLLNHLTVGENIALPLKIIGEPEADIRMKVGEMLEWIGLGEAHDAHPETLSGGQQQRVAIARAVITKPHLLLADEPTGNLDPELSERFIYLFEALNHMGTTVLIATHDEQLISHFNYPVLRLADGRIQPPSDLPLTAKAV